MFWSWLWTVISSATFVGIIAFFMRDFISKLFSKSIEYKFETKLEKLKAEIRGGESELVEIRSFLVSAKRERDSAIQTKRLEAAELLLRIRHKLSHFSILVEYMKSLNTEEILNTEDSKVAEFINLLIKPFDIDENIASFKKIDKTIPQLYLSEKSLKIFDLYESIILQAIVMMKLFSLEISDKKKFVNTNNINDRVIELVPTSKSGFDEHGDKYIYYCASYFYDEILKELRQEVLGNNERYKDVISAEQLALDSHQAHFNIMSSLEKTGISKTFVNSDKDN